MCAGNLHAAVRFDMICWIYWDIFGCLFELLHCYCFVVYWGYHVAAVLQC